MLYYKVMLTFLVVGWLSAMISMTFDGSSFLVHSCISIFGVGLFMALLAGLSILWMS